MSSPTNPFNGPGEREIWPKNFPEANPDKLLDEAERIVVAARKDSNAAKKSVGTHVEVSLHDMPVSVLDGRLGEICERRMRLFPRAYSWPSLVSVASALAPRQNPTTKFNVYSGIVGPVHSGKSQAIDWGQTLLGIQEPVLLDTFAGSAEGLICGMKEACGAPRLFSPDELGHLFAKSAIQNASFPYVLCRAFYRDRFRVFMGRGKATEFHASLSILGGLTEEKFQDSFSACTVAGLYDRFLLSCCPDGFTFDYQPFFGGVEQLCPVPVAIDPDVWIEKSAWLREIPDMQPRIAELAIRVASICASMDGRRCLTAKDLGPARELALYQIRIRRLLRPNPGETFGGKLAFQILEYLDRFAGRYVNKRELLRKINANRYGPDLVKRTYDTLHANGEIEEVTLGRTKVVRRVPDEETLPLILPPEQE